MIKAAHSAVAALEPEEAAHARGLTMLSLVHDTGHTRMEKPNEQCVVVLFFFVEAKLHSSNTVAASVEMNSATQEWQRVQPDTCVAAASTCARLRSCGAFRPSAGGAPGLF